MWRSKTSIVGEVVLRGLFKANVTWYASIKGIKIVKTQAEVFGVSRNKKLISWIIFFKPKNFLRQKHWKIFPHVYTRLN